MFARLLIPDAVAR